MKTVEMESKKNRNLFPERPVWLCGSDWSMVTLQQGLMVALPQWLAEKKKRERYADRVVSLGFDGLCFGGDGSGSGEVEDAVGPYLDGLHYMRDKGIKITLKVEATATSLHVLKPFCDFALYERRSRDPADKSDDLYNKPTRYEAAVEELKMMEETASDLSGLFFYLSTQSCEEALSQSQWFDRFINDCGVKTAMLLPAKEGEPWLDHRPLHPFWNSETPGRRPSGTALFSLINAGQYKQGEGLWPIFAFNAMQEHVDSVKARMPSARPMSMTASLPVEGSLLDGNLWIAARLSGGNKGSARSLAKVWLERYHPHWAGEERLCLLNEMAAIGRLLSAIRWQGNENVDDTDARRAMSEALLAQLKWLEVRLKPHLPKNSNAAVTAATATAPLEAYIPFFLRDARRTILYGLQRANIALPQVLNGDDMLEGFWTAIAGGGIGGGIRASAKVSLLEAPNAGAHGTIQEAISRGRQL